MNEGIIRNPSGRALTRTPVELRAIQRPTLLSALAEHVPASAFHFGQRIDRPTDAGLLVAADGVHSAFRPCIVPAEGPPRDAGCTAWRGLAPRDGLERWLDAGTASESWGRGTRFGIVPVDGEVIYWFAVAPVPPFGDPAAAHDFLTRTFRSWHEPIAGLLERTPPDAILESRLVDRLPLERWHDGSVLLLGDAAHPMTPNLGQGGCQAIEDGVVLGHLLRDAADGKLSLGDVPARYEALRMRRVHRVTALSYRIGEVANVANPFAVRVRDALFQLIPPAAQRKRLAPIVTFPGVSGG